MLLNRLNHSHDTLHVFHVIFVRLEEITHFLSNACTNLYQTYVSVSINVFLLRGCFSSVFSTCINVNCRTFRNVTSYSIKPWYHCPRDGGRAEIHKIFITPKLIKGRFNFGGGGGSSAKYMPNSVIFTVQLREVSRSS